MTSVRPSGVAWWALAAVGLSVTLALRDEVAERVLVPIDPSFWLSTNEEVGWQAAYYVMWAALSPAVFALARRFPFKRGHWLQPLALHTAGSLVVAGLSGVALGVLFGGLVRGDWPDPTGATIPSWVRLAGHRAVADASMYWLLLAGGILLDAHDKDRERAREAADLERALVTAQVDVLKMKLQPHFLFNTLNSISFLAIERDTRAVVTMVERLGVLLRSSMQSGGSQLVTVEKELALLDQYLAIEEVRFADRLRVVRRIDPAAKQALLPSLVLQPIIENSIKHGFSRCLDASRLEIDIRRDADWLLVAVTDDGPGLPADWELTTHCGRGLRNVVERLDALYRGAWSLSLENGVPRGTVATLRIPLAPPD